jgi:protein-L-isoaspartate O-methyltransferase
MANERQFKLRTQFIAARGVQEYRATIPYLVTAQDQVLELGCEWGSTTHLLARHGGSVIGTDVSAVCIKRARRMYPHLTFAVLDAFDVRAALDLGRTFTKIYMDLSGFSSYRALLDVVALMTMYATVFQPQAMVVKSGALKHFARSCAAWGDQHIHQQLAVHTTTRAADDAARTEVRS